MSSFYILLTIPEPIITVSLIIRDNNNYATTTTPPPLKLVSNETNIDSNDSIYQLNNGNIDVENEYSHNDELLHKNLDENTEIIVISDHHHHHDQSIDHHLICFIQLITFVISFILFAICFIIYKYKSKSKLILV